MPKKIVFVRGNSMQQFEYLQCKYLSALNCYNLINYEWQSNID
jgi:hypothetical protein